MSGRGGDIPDMLDLAAHGACILEPGPRKGMGKFVLAQQRPDGGYAGRDGGGSDLYYTVFAAGVLAALGRWRPFLGAARYARGRGHDRITDFVHLACLARLNGRLARFRLAGRHTGPERLEAFRSADGGYHHTRRGEAQGTAYAAFLATLAYGDWGRALPEPDRLVESLAPLRTGDLGYANQPGEPKGNTNATAAATMVRLLHGGRVEAGTLDVLRGRFHPAGGFHATPDAPIPDLLSTAATLYALRAAGAEVDAFRGGTLAFIEQCWDESGGFRGHLLDDRADCEYTLYGLLALGCLA